MTCIVGLIEEGKVYIGGDSAGVAGYDLTVRADQKVWAKDGWAFGFTSSFRMGQILRYGLQVPKRHADMDLMQFMVTEFTNAVRNCLKAAGWASKVNEREEGGVFLIGHAGRLFQMHSDYQIAESVHGYDACGCGEAYAKGALYAMRRTTPKEAAEKALACAETFSAGVRGPFHVVEV